MTSEQIRFFLAIERSLNFTAAADDLNVSQPSLSRHIQNLENEIGVPLFNRSTRKISLTPAGEIFSKFAREFIKDYNDLMMEINKYSPKHKRIIKFSSMPVMSIYRITEMVAAFNLARPDITLDIIEEDTLPVLKSVGELKADLGLIITNLAPGEGFKMYPVIEDDLVIIVNKNHRFADRKEMSLSEASKENFILLGVDTGMYTVCFEECKKAGFEPKIINAPYTNMQIDTIIDFVSKGIGISIMMAKAAEYFSNSEYRVIVPKERMKIHLAFLLRDEPVPNACKAFLNFAIDYYNRDEAGPTGGTSETAV